MPILLCKPVLADSHEHIHAHVTLAPFLGGYHAGYRHLR
jgi:hypothetical protein